MSAPTNAIIAGTIMLPEPRMTFASELNSQIRIAPPNTTLEYVSAAVSAPPRPPMASP